MSSLKHDQQGHEQWLKQSRQQQEEQEQRGDVDSHAYAKRFLEQMGHLREINKTVESKTSTIFYQTIETIIAHMKFVEHMFEDMVDKIDNKEDDVNYGELANYLTTLKQYDWVFKIRNGTNQSKVNKNEVFRGGK